MGRGLISITGRELVRIKGRGLVSVTGSILVSITGRGLVNTVLLLGVSLVLWVGNSSKQYYG